MVNADVPKKGAGLQLELLLHSEPVDGFGWQESTCKLVTGHTFSVKFSFSLSLE